MPRDSNGNYTKPNPSVVAGTTVQAAYENTNTDDQATELTDSLSRSGKGPMLEALKLADAGAVFGTEETSGIRRVGAGDIRSAVLNTDVLQLMQASLQFYVQAYMADVGIGFQSEQTSKLRREAAGDIRLSALGTDVFRSVPGTNELEIRDASIAAFTPARVVSATLAALKAEAIPADGTVRYMKSREAAGDGAHGWFRFDSSNLSAEVTADPQNGIYVPPDSATTGASGAWVRQYNVEVIPEWFGAKADGATVDSTAIQAAINTGRRVAFSAGRTYVIGPSLTHSSNGVMNLNLGEATLLQNANNWTIDANISYTNEQTVSSVSTTTYDFTQGEGNNTTCSALAVADGSVFADNDVIKVYSDDSVPYLGGNEKYGEHALVGAVSGNTVYVSGLLEFRDSYTTNIRVAKMGDSFIRIDGGILDSQASGYAAGWNIGQVRISGAKYPTVNGLKIVRSYRQGIMTMSCFGALLENLEISGLYNEPENDRFGYGINDSASYGTTVIAPRVDSGRHAFTTTVPRHLPTTTRQYGLTLFAKVIGGIGTNGLGAPWDTHTDAWKCEFHDCTATTSVRGKQSGWPQYNIRGWHNRLVNCRSSGGEVGVQFFAEFDNGTQHCSIEGGSYSAYSRAIDMSNSQTTLFEGMRILNVDTETFSGQENIFLRLGNYTIVGGRHTNRSSVDDRSIFQFFNFAHAYVADIEFAFTSSTGADRFLVRVAGTGSSIKTKRITQYGGQSLDTIFNTRGAASYQMIALDVSLTAALNPAYRQGFREITDTQAQAWIQYFVDNTRVEVLQTADFTNQNHYVNSFKKFSGKMLWNSETNRPVWAAGSANTSVWIDGSGATVHTPV